MKLREVEALEGIENKTGTFHLDIECPSTGTISQDIQCTLTAYVEDSQIMEKEVDFTCYISDGTSQYSSINFNQMITKNAFTTIRNFAIPSTFNSGQQYVLQCHADYYNLGSRRDSFYDTFTAYSSGGGGSGGASGGTTDSNKEKVPFTGGAIGVDDFFGNDGDIWNPLTPRGRTFYVSTFILLILIASIILIIIKYKKKDIHYHPPKTCSDKSRKIIKNTLIIIASGIAIALLATGLFYLYGFITSTQTTQLQAYTYKFIEDPLFRAMIFITFITIITIILFKILRIKLNISINQKSPIENYWRKIHKD